jgi:hypothetical protein
VQPESASDETPIEGSSVDANAGDTSSIDVSIPDTSPIDSSGLDAVSEPDVSLCIVDNDAATGAVEEAHFTFDEGRGSVAADSSGHCRVGTFVGAVSWTTGKKGGAIALNPGGAGTGYVDVADPVINTSTSYSVAAWARLDSPLVHNETFVSQDGPALSSFFLQFKDTTLAYAAFANISGGNITVARANAPVTGTWYHMAAVYDSTTTTVSLYVNGAFQSSQSYPTPWTASGHLIIGRAKYNGLSTDFVSGAIDDVRIFKGALTAAEVAAIAAP